MVYAVVHDGVGYKIAVKRGRPGPLMSYWLSETVVTARRLWGGVLEADDDAELDRRTARTAVDERR